MDAMRLAVRPSLINLLICYAVWCIKRGQCDLRGPALPPQPCRWRVGGTRRRPRCSGTARHRIVPATGPLLQGRAIRPAYPSELPNHVQDLPWLRLWREQRPDTFQHRGRDMRRGDVRAGGVLPSAAAVLGVSLRVRGRAVRWEVGCARCGRRGGGAGPNTVRAAQGAVTRPSRFPL